MAAHSLKDRRDRTRIRVLGFDPGTRVTGWGMVAGQHRAELVEVGVIKPVSGQPLELRLDAIYSGARELIERLAPDVVAVEDPFVGKSVSSALKLGQARGVLLLAAARAGVPVASYSPKAVKASVVGRGTAAKEQVQFMVMRLLGLLDPPEPLDASDALAVALCHLNRGSAQPGAAAGRDPRDVARGARSKEDEELIARWKAGHGRKR